MEERKLSVEEINKIFFFMNSKLKYTKSGSTGHTFKYVLNKNSHQSGMICFVDENEINQTNQDIQTLQSIPMAQVE